MKDKMAEQDRLNAPKMGYSERVDEIREDEYPLLRGTVSPLWTLS